MYSFYSISFFTSHLSTLVNSSHHCPDEMDFEQFLFALPFVVIIGII
jgi:hypothetical protein